MSQSQQLPPPIPTHPDSHTSSSSSSSTTNTHSQLPNFPPPSSPPPASASPPRPSSPPTNANPQPSLKRTSSALASSTEDHIADLIRRAKASRTSAAGPAGLLLLRRESSGLSIASAGKGKGKDIEEEKQKEEKRFKDPMDASIEMLLTCPICTDLFHRPVTVLTCLHTFCGVCIVRWIEQSGNCPTCRRGVTSVKDDYRTNSLLEIFLHHHPEFIRPAEEVLALDDVYKPGQHVSIIHDPYESDYGENEDQGFLGNGPRLQPCECCAEGNEHGYVCPHPVRAEDAVHSEEYMIAADTHVLCSRCPRVLPTGLRETECMDCSLRWCGTKFECRDADSVGLLKKTGDFQVNELGFLPAEGFRKTNIPSDGIEFQLFMNYAQENNFTNDDIASKVQAHLLSYLSHTFLCTSCFRMRLERVFMDWWIAERERVALVDNREKCWYGRNCRTQRHSVMHAERLIHACLPDPDRGDRMRNQAVRQRRQQAAIIQQQNEEQEDEDEDEDVPSNMTASQLLGDTDENGAADAGEGPAGGDVVMDGVDGVEGPAEVAVVEA